MATFEPVFFGLPDRDDFVHEMTRRYPEAAAGDLIEKFDHWAAAMSHHLQLFYRTQYIRHQRIVERDFCALHGIEPWDMNDREIWEAWDEFILSSGLPEHEMMSEMYTESALRFNPRQRAPTGASASQWVARLLEGGRIQNLPGPKMGDCTAWWFHRETATDPIQVPALRAMPYKDYLKTPHWRRIRAAMLLVNRAVCQAETCSIIGEGYYGDEVYINVHHLTYKNLGAERFEDLALLCDKHHDRWHENKKAGREQFRIVRGRMG